MTPGFETAEEIDVTVWEADPSPTDLVTSTGQELILPNERVAIIRTSDRSQYKGCRRRWGWSSHLKGNLGPKTDADPLWMGSGFHFALEDFHGLNEYGHPVEAFKAFVRATAEYNKQKVPADWQGLSELAMYMLEYYADYWLKQRDPLQTYIHNGIPQVEVNFRVELPWERGKYDIDRVIYSGTLDRVIIDEYGRLWILEYKTAKIIQTLHLSIDGQVSAYCWAGNQLYGKKIEGVIYQQHLKSIPHPPKILGNGKVSADVRQRTTHRLYRKTLVNIYGDVMRAPRENVDLLNQLALKETITADAFVRRDKTERNEHQIQAEGAKILMEVDEMLNPHTALYPNPKRECIHFCPFYGPCGSMDDGSDYMYELELMMNPREKVYDSWRKLLQKPTQPLLLQEQHLLTGPSPLTLPTEAEQLQSTPT